MSNKRKLTFDSNDSSLVFKNQIIAWILSIDKEMDEFVSNLDNYTTEEKGQIITRYYQSMLIINKVLDGRSVFFGNQLLSQDFGIHEEHL